jgi:uroporphyrinogen-III synthase
MKIKSIFLSSNSDSSLPIVDFCNKNGILLARRSFISFQQVPFEVPNDWEVVFFSSPRSFDFFVSDHFSLESHQQIACIGEETKNHIEFRGYVVSFFGENAGNPKEIANEFKDWLGPRRALFPQSTRSNKSIETELPETQRIPLLVYETVEDPILFREVFSIYIFTSPSNYHSFISVNSIPKEAKILAWGTTTSRAIVKSGRTVDFILKTSTYSELHRILLELI